MMGFLRFTSGGTPANFLTANTLYPLTFQALVKSSPFQIAFGQQNIFNLLDLDRQEMSFF